MPVISKKTTYVSDNAWRGRVVPLNAVGAANDTGTWSDSPCPSHLVKAEIDGFRSKLRKARISFRTMWGNSSNCFMAVRYVLVAKADRAKALEIAREHRGETKFFYPVDDVEGIV